MAAPRLRLRRGTTAPSGNIALVGEPFVDTTNKNFYVADGGSSFVHIGGGSYTARVDEFLTASVASTSVGSVTLKDSQATQNSVTIDVPATVTTSYNFTLPSNAGTDGYILKTDGSGNTSWVQQSAGFANWVLSDGSNSQTINSTDTVTVAGGIGISTTVSATDTVTIDLNIEELTAETTVADADTFAMHDASADATRKVTASNIALYALGEATGDVTFSNGVAQIANDAVDLGTHTTGNYVADVTAGAGLAKTSSAGEGQTVDLAVGAGEGITVNADNVALNITGLTADTIADADELAFYDTDGAGHNKITASNLALYVLQEATGDVTFNGSGTAQIANNAVDLGTHTTGQYASTITGGSGIAATAANVDDATAYTIDLDINELVALDAEGGADPLVVGDSIPVYDASATGNKKVTVGNLETVIFADVSGDITIAANGTAAIGSGVIVNGDISATAEIAVSKLANGTARQLLQTDAAGTGVEWASNIDVPGTLDVTGIAQFDNNVVITGDLTVNGTTTTIATTNTVISDRLLELANGTTGTPTADAGLVIERGDSSNVFIGFDEGSDLFVVGTTSGTGSSTDLAPTPIAFLALQYNVTDTAGTNEAVIAYNGTSSQRELQNVVVDAGTY